MKSKTIAILLSVSLIAIIVFVVGLITKNDIEESKPATAPTGITSSYQTDFETDFAINQTETTQQNNASEPIFYYKSKVEPTEETKIYTIEQKEIDSIIESTSITIDDNLFNVPSSVNDLKIGFELPADFKKMKLKYNEINNPSVYKGRNLKGDSFILHIKNNNTKTLPYSKCDIVGAEFYVKNLNKTDVSFSNLGSIKSLTLEKLERKIGVAPIKNTIDNVVICNYCPDKSSSKLLTFTFVDGKLTHVEIQKRT